MSDLTPSARIIEAEKTKTVTDASGRSITIRKLDALDKMELMGMVGADKAQNPGYMGYVMVSASVTNIDGTPYTMPENMVAVRGRVKLVGDVGMAALLPAFGELNGSNSADVIEEAKN